MSDKFQNKYRSQSIRLQSWDYTTPWWYFITISTKNHINYFGKISNGKMILNEIGALVEKEWVKCRELRNNVELDEFVIMPNHFHAIVIINEKNDIQRNEINYSSKKQKVIHEYFSKISPNPSSLSSIVRAFKSAVTKSVHDSGNYIFKWQPKFYDRIIRNDKELFNIRKYIKQNPFKWELGKETPDNLNLL